LVEKDNDLKGEDKALKTERTARETSPLTKKEDGDTQTN
jgi:hypothetical protein